MPAHHELVVDALLACAVLAFTIPTSMIGYSFAVWGRAPFWIEVLVGVVTAATMFVRCRTPWPAVVASAVCACVTGQTVPMALAAFSMTAEHRPRRWQYVALALVAVYWVVDYMDPHTDRSVYLNVVRAVTLIYLPALVGTWVYAYRRMVWDLRRGVREREEIAAAEERRKIAREMHDTVTHAVTAMVLSAGMARDATEPGEVRELTATIEDKGVQALSELRELLTVLRHEEGTSPGASTPSRGWSARRRRPASTSTSASTSPGRPAEAGLARVLPAGAGGSQQHPQARPRHPGAGDL